MKNLKLLGRLKIKTIEDLLAVSEEFLHEKILKRKVRSFVLHIRRILKSLAKRKISSEFYKLQKEKDLRYNVRLGICIVRIFKGILTRVEEVFNDLLRNISVYCSRNQLHIAKTLL